MVPQGRLPSSPLQNRRMGRLGPSRNRPRWVIKVVVTLSPPTVETRRLSAEPPVEEDDSTQLVTVEQDASVFVRGYQGSVVTRLRFDQDVDLDQDFNLEVHTDGDGYFLVFIDQDMRIDEDLWIDLDIFDENNVLYVDLFMRDSVEVDQTTSVRIGTSDNGQGGSVVVEQSVDADQSFGLDIDIEDELEERYRMSVDVAVLEQLYTDQDVDLDIVGHTRWSSTWIMMRIKRSSSTTRRSFASISQWHEAAHVPAAEPPVPRPDDP